MITNLLIGIQMSYQNTEKYPPGLNASLNRIADKSLYQLGPFLIR